MDSSVILVSSESSAPSSPMHGIHSKHTPDYSNEQHSDSDARSDITVDYYMPINVRKSPEVDHDSSTTSSLPKVNTNTTMDCPEVQFSDSDARSDTIVDYYPPPNFINDLVLKTESRGNDISGSCSAGVLHKAWRETQLVDCEGSDDSHLDMREAMQGRDQLPSIGNVLAEDCSEKGQKKQRAKKSVIGIEKEGKRAERMKNRAMMKAEQAQKKALKMAAAEAYRCKKPGECLKYIQVCLDQQLLTAEYGGEILVSLQSAEMQYNIQSNLVPCSIFWTREVQEHFVGEDMEVHVRSRKEEEEEILIVWHWEKVMRLIHAVDLTNHIQSLQLTLPGKKLTLVVYGVEQYFRYHNSSKRQEVRAKVGKLKTSKKTENFENTPRISRDKFDTALTELQLFADCSHRLVEKPHDLGTFIRQFSKAIAEVPFKHEKQKREQEKLEWYAAGDSRNCVRVDKNGNGLLRLWQQQLCQFNRVSMETAQAISSVYRSPCALIQAYENCSSETESELMLESIQIRRGVGPLTTVKKVGPGLSKKMYTFFRSFDGKATLSQE